MSLMLLRMKNVSDKSCRQTRNTRFMLNNFSSKILPFMRHVEKYCRAGHARLQYDACALHAGYL